MISFRLASQRKNKTSKKGWRSLLRRMFQRDRFQFTLESEKTFKTRHFTLFRFCFLSCMTATVSDVYERRNHGAVSLKFRCLINITTEFSRRLQNVWKLVDRNICIHFIKNLRTDQNFDWKLIHYLSSYKINWPNWFRFMKWFCLRLLNLVSL